VRPGLEGGKTKRSRRNVLRGKVRYFLASVCPVKAERCFNEGGKQKTSLGRADQFIKKKKKKKKEEMIGEHA